jgi:hypothetical protein
MDNEPVQDDVYDNGNGDRRGDNNANNTAGTEADNSIGAFGTGPMSKGDMDGLKSMVRGKDGDADKIQVLESQTRGKSFTTDQVSKMMGWLSSDDSKLELAEWAYPFITDKEKYNKLGSMFKDANYLKRLDDFIQSRK